jgi:hypothetical protein
MLQVTPVEMLHPLRTTVPAGSILPEKVFVHLLHLDLVLVVHRLGVSQQCLQLLRGLS